MPLILDEPTRGVDVGAKAEIHGLIDRLAGDGCAVVLISSELPELLALATRIVVLRGGRVVGELSRAAASEELAIGKRLGGGEDVDLHEVHYLRRGQRRPPRLCRRREPVAGSGGNGLIRGGAA